MKLNKQTLKETEEAMKKLIFKNYMKTRSLSDNEWKFCEKIDWHPVDELPLKEGFVKKIKRIEIKKFTKIKKISDIFDSLGDHKIKKCSHL